MLVQIELDSLELSERCAVVGILTDPIVLAVLANDVHTRVRKAVATNPYILPETQMKLAEDVREEVRLALASNPGASLECLKKLSRDMSSFVLRAVIKNQITPTEVLGEIPLMDEWIIVYLAKNKNTPLERLKEFANINWGCVQLALAENVSTPPEILTKLAQSSDWRVLEEVGANPSTPVEIRKKLGYGLRAK